MPPQQEHIDEERAHLANVITTFKGYAQYQLSANNRRRKDLYTLPKPDQDILSKIGYREKLDAVDDAIAKNSDFLGLVVADPEIFGPDGEPTEGEEQPTSEHSHAHSHGHDHGHAYEHGHSHSHGGQSKRGRYKPTDFDMDKLRSTLKQLVRDWSAEGKAERDACYTPMTDALVAHFADVPEAERRNRRVLVPGAGLGRLAYEVARLGFASQGNEFSLTTSVDSYKIYPYVHSFSNLATCDALLRPISIPDVLPSDMPKGVPFSYVMGDFEEVYNGDADPDEPHVGLWDAILTCFFIDTAKNIVNYLRILYEILAPGGVWINLGPLLWHWENNTTHDTSIELTLDEVKNLAREIGFVIENERSMDTTYTNNPESMLGGVSGLATGGLIRGVTAGRRTIIPAALMTGVACVALQAAYNELRVQRIKYIGKRAAGPPIDDDKPPLADRILGALGVRPLSNEDVIEKLKRERERYLQKIERLEAQLADEQERKQK
ncbi:N2227 domain-containing protein [Mycena kentingensis (nom. inval.)]|nr:N2227 domain-containing protein [Mycena kentingensis (nom. inval.)]